MIVIQVNQLIGLIWIGIFTSAIAFTSWALALEKGDTAKISNLAYMTPEVIARDLGKHPMSYYFQPLLAPKQYYEKKKIYLIQ